MFFQGYHTSFGRTLTKEKGGNICGQGGRVPMHCLMFHKTTVIHIVGSIYYPCSFDRSSNSNSYLDIQEILARIKGVMTIVRKLAFDNAARFCFDLRTIP